MARNAVASIDETLGWRCCPDRRQPTEKSKALLLPDGRRRLPPEPAAGRRPGLAVVGDNRALERTVERGQHAAFDEIEGSRLAVARAWQIARNLLVDAAWMRPHHDDAIGQHDRLLDVVSHNDQRR